jgi:hypothetical protein
MTTGLAMPVGVNSHGGAKLVSKDTQATKIIGIALSDLDNDNAYQQGEGLGNSLIFDPSGPAFRAKVRRRLLDLFDEFERKKLFKIVTRSIQWRRTAEGEQTLEFQYVNLESDQATTFSKTYNQKAR